MDDFGGKPLPVRLAYSYSNGVRVSHNARAVSRHDGELLVLATEQFEAGTVLSVWAPLFKGRTACRVQRVLPSKRWAGHFEMILQVADGASSQASPGAQKSNPSRASAEPPAPDPAGLPPEALSPETLSPETLSEDTLARSAHQLAGALEKLPGSGFCEAFAMVPASSRRPALVTATAAMLHLLQQKGMVHVRSLLVLAKEVAKTS